MSVHQKFGFWHSSCFVQAGEQTPKSPAPLPCGKNAQRPVSKPPQSSDVCTSPPSTHHSEHMVTGGLPISTVKLTQMPAHPGSGAIASHTAPLGRPMCGISTQTLACGSQTRGASHCESE